MPHEWAHVADDELVAWLPVGHELAGADAFPVAKLADYPFVITRPGEDTDIDRLLAAHGLVADVRFATSDAFATYRMVEAGLGISLNQRLIAHEWRGRVACVPFDPPQTVELGIAAPTFGDTSPAARKLMEYV